MFEGREQGGTIHQLVELTGCTAEQLWHGDITDNGKPLGRIVQVVD